MSSYRKYQTVAKALRPKGKITSDIERALSDQKPSRQNKTSRNVWKKRGSGKAHLLYQINLISRWLAVRRQQ